MSFLVFVSPHALTPSYHVAKKKKPAFLCAAYYITPGFTTDLPGPCPLPALTPNGYEKTNAKNQLTHIPRTHKTSSVPTAAASSGPRVSLGRSTSKVQGRGRNDTSTKYNLPHKDKIELPEKAKFEKPQESFWIRHDIRGPGNLLKRTPPYFRILFSLHPSSSVRLPLLHHQKNALQRCRP